MIRAAKKEGDSSQWQWHPNIFDLHRYVNDNLVSFNCAPYVMITKGEEEDHEPELSVAIEMSRPFKKEDNLGYHWHKSWNIPTIDLLVTLEDSVTMWEIELPTNLEANLIAAKLLQGPYGGYFEEIALKGDTKLRVVDGKARFEGIKFDTTSYNHGVGLY